MTTAIKTKSAQSPNLDRRQTSSRGGTSVRRFRRLLRAQTVAAGMSLHRSRTRASRFSPALIGRAPTASPARTTSDRISFLLGGGLEPPCLSAYAPQTYVSAISPPERWRICVGEIAANPNLPQPEFGKSLV